MKRRHCGADRAGDVQAIEEAMEHSLAPESQSFEQGLYELLQKSAGDAAKTLWRRRFKKNNLLWLIKRRRQASQSTPRAWPRKRSSRRRRFPSSRQHLTAPKVCAAHSACGRRQFVRRRSAACRPPSQLAQQLIAAPFDHSGRRRCQPLIAARLAPLGFAAEAISRTAPQSLARGEAPCGRWWCSRSHRCCATRSRENCVVCRTLRSERRCFGSWRCDMKSSIAAFVVAAEQFVRAHPTHAGSIALLLTSDEEGAALDGTIAVVEACASERNRSTAGIVGKPTSVQR